MVKARRCPGSRCMARIAGVGCCNMRRWLTRYLGIVVAGEAGAGGLCMIKASRYPGSRDMARVAGIRRCQVSCRLASCRGVVVTGEACSSYSRMVERCIGPACGDMAILANIRGGQMIRRFAYGWWVQLVMAGETAADGRCMIKLRRRFPGREAGVAILANIQRCKVGGAFARGYGGVVAGETIAGDIGGNVIKTSGFPRCSALMAIFASV